MALALLNPEILIPEPTLPRGPVLPPTRAGDIRRDAFDPLWKIEAPLEPKRFVPHHVDRTKRAKAKASRKARKRNRR